MEPMQFIERFATLNKRCEIGVVFGEKYQ